ncbi:hypothetical protein BC829DRAFT_380138 [Chytridium lagenaria]|nr:hypothetical protein BC829DRAFT_380138 [Chytridium lagenaria]
MYSWGSVFQRFQVYGTSEERAKVSAGGWFEFRGITSKSQDSCGWEAGWVSGGGQSERTELGRFGKCQVRRWSGRCVRRY